MSAKVFSYVDLKLALEKQRRSIPYFATKERLNLKLKHTDEDLLIYDYEENKYYIAGWRNGITIFDRLALMSDVISGGGIKTQTPFVIQTSVAVTHNSGYYPSVIIQDNSGYEFEGSVQHLNVNQLVVLFNKPQSGLIITN